MRRSRADEAPTVFLPQCRDLPTPLKMRVYEEPLDMPSLSTRAKLTSCFRAACFQLRMNAIAFPFLADGIPMMYSGGEQGFEGGEWDGVCDGSRSI